MTSTASPTEPRIPRSLLRHSINVDLTKDLSAELHEAFALLASKHGRSLKGETIVAIIAYIAANQGVIDAPPEAKFNPADWRGDITINGQPIEEMYGKPYPPGTFDDKGDAVKMDAVPVIQAPPLQATTDTNSPTT